MSMTPSYLTPGNNKSSIQDWNPEDPHFWEVTGKKIAKRNLIVSTISLMIAFCVWQIWATVAIHLNQVGFHFTESQIFTLAALPGLIGATLRLFYTFMPSVFGGKNWTIVSTALLLLPAIGLGNAVQDPTTSYESMMILAGLCGLGGGNFSSSMANIGGFYPKSQRGTALGINGGFGNLGVSIVHLVTPIVMATAIFGSFAGDSQTKIASNTQVWLQNVAYVWIIPIIIALVLQIFFMNNLPNMKQSPKDMFVIFKRKHTWIMTIIYTCCFGSFIGFSSALTLLANKEFPDVSFAYFAFIGPFIGASLRPVGGWLSDKINSGSKVTFYDFILLILFAGAVLYFIQIHHFMGFLISFILLFATTGIANGSTFRMIPNIFETKESSLVTGFVAALAAYGAFFIPKFFGWSYTSYGNVNAAFYLLIGFYILSLLLTWFYYFRKNAEVKC